MSLGPRPAQAQDARQALRAARQARAQGDTKTARAMLIAAAKDAPTWSLVQLEFAEFLMMQGGDAEQVGQHLEAARLVDPHSARLNYLLGLHYESEGHKAQAAAAYEAAIAARSGFLDAHLRLGHLLMEEGKFSLAASHLQQVAEKRPDSTAPWVMLAKALRAGDDLVGAEAALKRATRLAPKNAYHWARLAAFYESEGNKRKAKSARARADALSSGSSHPKVMRPLPPSRR